MTNMPEVLDFLMHLRVELQMGHSVARSLEKTFENRNDGFSKSLRSWLIRTQAGQSHDEITTLLPVLVETAGRRSFLYILNRGLSGSPIDESLGALEQEFFLAAENLYERQLQTLPLKLLIPLTLFILPGMMLLIIGPVFNVLQGGF